jgi:hypothetical protein
VITIGTNISNLKISNGKDTSFSKGIIGDVSILVLKHHKFITKDMQNTIFVKKLLNGLFQYVNLVRTNNIADNLNFQTHNSHFAKKWVKYSADASAITQKLNKAIKIKKIKIS